MFSQSGCIRFLGYFCRLYQHHIAANSRECSRTCWISHICIEKQAGTCTYIPDNHFVNNHLVITLTILGLNRIYLWVSLGSATQISLFVVGNILPFIGCCSLSQKLLNYFTIFFCLKMIIFFFSDSPMCDCRVDHRSYI